MSCLGVTEWGMNNGSGIRVAFAPDSTPKGGGGGRDKGCICLCKACQG